GIKGCGFNLSDFFTMPLPQQFSQDLIYSAIKREPKNKYYRKIVEMRKCNYEEGKFSKSQM
ncbi:MAG: hypothetical protein KKA64_03440, partial [Nanoarchaeota archaeon]|nr:hypothetical protein [Nanoarchaeota archaeon]